MGCKKEETPKVDEEVLKQKLLGTWTGTVNEELSQNIFTMNLTLSDMTTDVKAGEGTATVGSKRTLPFDWIYKSYSKERFRFTQTFTGTGPDSGNSSTVSVTFEHDNEIKVVWTPLRWSGTLTKK